MKDKSDSYDFIQNKRKTPDSYDNISRSEGKKLNNKSLLPKKISKVNKKKRKAKPSHISTNFSIKLPFDKDIFIPNTIEEIHKKALDIFNKIKNEADLDYIRIYDEVIKKYDLDENINGFFLNKLNEYYKKN